MATKRFKVSYAGNDLKSEKIEINQSMSLLSFRMYSLKHKVGQDNYEYFIFDLSNNYLIENRLSLSPDYMAASDALIINDPFKKINLDKILSDFKKVSKDSALKLSLNNEGCADNLVSFKSLDEAFDYLDKSLK